MISSIRILLLSAVLLLTVSCCKMQKKELQIIKQDGHILVKSDVVKDSSADYIVWWSKDSVLYYYTPLEDKTVVLYSGQFIDRKNQEFAIDAVLSSTSAEQIHMVLMGDGPNLLRLKEKYRSNANIQFTGNVTNVNEYLQAGDLYISASKSEGMPNGVLEAMATGLPVLLSDIPQHLEVLEVSDGYGTSYKQENKKDFISKLDKLLNEDLRAMGKRASDTAKQELSANQMSKRYQELYLSLINKR